MLEDLVESGRSYLVLFLCVLLPVGVTAATAKLESTVQEFRVFRLAQLDYQGTQYGSRAWRVSHEAASLGSRQQIRRALVVWWKELTEDPANLGNLLHAALGSVIIVLPKSLAHFTQEEREKFLELERNLLKQSWPMPVLFCFRTPEVAGVLDSLVAAQTAARGSALTALLDAVTANAFQIVGANAASSATIERPMHNVLGRLSAYERGGAVPTLLVVAHYDAMGGAPGLVEGADSNGSGVAALLELLRIFHRLYASPRTRPKYNMVFLLSGGGKANFQGTRQWIEEHFEADEQDLELALCLDTIGGGSELFAHVSKIPKEDSPVSLLAASLADAAARRGLKSQLVQKKINLGEPMLAWEHERFNIRKLRAVTLSRHQQPHWALSRSVLDTRAEVDQAALARHVETVAEGLLAYLFRLQAGQSPAALLGPGGVSRSNLGVWLERLGEPGARSMPSLAEKGKDSPLLGDLVAYVDAHSAGAELKAIPPDPKDPEVVLYGATEDKLTVHRVKPAVFDLFLAAGIAAYLSLTYVAVVKLQFVVPLLQSLSARFLKAKAH